MQRVVIIDDDDIFLFLSSKALENIGLTEEIKSFTDSKTGLEYLENLTDSKSYPTIMMVDINMPRLDGWAIVEGLEKGNPKLAESCKIFILSSSVDVKDKQKALSYRSVSGFIIKPLSEEHLTEIAKEHFGAE